MSKIILFMAGILAHWSAFCKSFFIDILPLLWKMENAAAGDSG